MDGSRGRGSGIVGVGGLHDAGPASADDLAAAAAMDAIRQDRVLDNGAVTVSVSQGTATVSGVVDGNTVRARVLEIVENMDGIYRVVDRLLVR